MPIEPGFHSDEAQQIMGKAPSWVIRWGITIILIILAGIVAGCYFIKYPETVKAPVVITTINPPSDLAARSEGLIQHIFGEDGEKVKAGTLIAVLSNPADHACVDSLSRFLQREENRAVTDLVECEWIDRHYNLGEIQSVYSDFIRKCQDYRNYLVVGYIDRKIDLISAQIAKNQEYYNRLMAQQTIMEEDAQYVERNIRRDSLLFSKGVISTSEYETAYRSKLDKQNSIAGFKATLVATELTMIQNEQQIIELTLQKQNEIADHERSIIQARSQLMAAIDQWKEIYLIVSPIDGTVTFTNYWSDNQRVKAGEIVATVIPEGSLSVTGRMYIPSAGFGKVEQGQTVNIKLNGFPYMEFGILKGEIKSISAVPDAEKGYVADVRFPGELITSYGKTLPLIQQMDGDGEVITADKRLIERFIDPVKALFKAR